MVVESELRERGVAGGVTVGKTWGTCRVMGVFGADRYESVMPTESPAQPSVNTPICGRMRTKTRKFPRSF